VEEIALRKGGKLELPSRCERETLLVVDDTAASMPAEKRYVRRRVVHGMIEDVDEPAIEKALVAHGSD
jgi:hypothetical protein